MKLSVLILIILIITNNIESYRSEDIYSSYKCIGGNDYPQDAMKRHCVFHNLCHKAGEGDVLHYYVNNRLPRKPILVHSNLYQYEFGDNFLQLGTFEKFSKQWGPSISPEPVPSTFPFDNSSRAIFYQSFAETNPGHFFDFLHSVFALPALLGYKPSTDIRVLTHSQSHYVKKHRAQLLSTLTQYEPVKLKDMGDICFNTVFAGAGSLSMLEGSTFASITGINMRDYMLDNLNFTKQTSSDIQKHVIIILEKAVDAKSSDGKGSSNNFNHFTNHDDLVNYLSGKLNGVAEVIGLLPDNMTWSEQIATIRKASVIVTPPGGIAFLAMFAREGVSLIISDKNYRGVTVREVSLVGSDDNWWSNVQRAFNFLHYPVCNSWENDGDIVVTIHRMYYVIILGMILVENEQIGANIKSKISDIWPIVTNSTFSGEVDVCALTEENFPLKTWEVK